MPNIYSASQINNYIKNMFAQDYMLGHVYIKGEVSNLKYHSTGHIYFTIKDEKSAINAIMFAGNRAKGLKFQMEEGQSIVAFGSVEVYDRDGKYQLYARSIELAGVGDLKEKFEALKEKLYEMGMFADEYKQPIPKYIKKLGVVTAPTGAAIQDIITVSKRRNPYIDIILYPALVQGDGAPESIIKGIKALESYGVDVIIVGRGGGSMEDLWGFNDEGVAQAIFDCSIPIISAVGHEVDFTIADFVADLRAATPSAAAELAVYEYSSLNELISKYQDKLARLMEYKLESAKHESDRRKITLNSLSPVSRLNEKRMRMVAIEERLNALMNEKVNKSKHTLGIYAEKLNGLSPAYKLSLGFSHTSDAAGKTVHSILQVKKGDIISVHVEDGIVNATVNKTDTYK